MCQSVYRFLFQLTHWSGVSARRDVYWMTDSLCMVGVGLSGRKCIVLSVKENPGQFYRFLPTV